MRLCVFGPLLVETDHWTFGGRDFPGVKPKQLLEILVAERGHAVSKGRLAETLWEGALPQNYRATLESYISVLRQLLQPGAKARDSVIVTEHGGYRLDAARMAVDFDELYQLLRSAEAMEPSVAVGTLNRALGLGGGHRFEEEP